MPTVKKLALSAAVFFLIFQALHMAFTYGAIWDMQDRPTRDVTVVFDNGEKLQGDLRQTWARKWTITDQTGRVTTFTDYRMMSFKEPEKAASSLSYKQVLLPTLVILLILAGIMVMWRGETRNKSA